MSFMLPSASDHVELRDAMRALCATFDSAYWQKIDDERGYPEAFADALTKAGWLFRFGARRSVNYYGRNQSIWR